jgi:hypothetical protein
MEYKLTKIKRNEISFYSLIIIIARNYEQVTVKGCEVFHNYVGNVKNVGHSDANSVFDKRHGRARSKRGVSKSRFIELCNWKKENTIF